MNRGPDLYLVDEALKEWGFFFRDRRRLEHCRSIEHRFRATSDDFGPSGWGDEEAAPKTSPARSWRILEALKTHDQVMALPKVNKWAITYAYCYPSLGTGLTLRMMKKWTGKRMNWKAYLEQLDIGRFRVYAALLGANHNI